MQTRSDRPGSSGATRSGESRPPARSDDALGEEATVVVVAGSGSRSEDGAASHTYLVPREELLLAAARESGAAEATELDSPELLAAVRERELAAVREAPAEPTFVSSLEPGFDDRSALASPSDRAPALRPASEEEAEFFRRQVRAGRGTRRYSLESVRDAGGMGTVLEVLDLDLGRRMAMKILLPKWRGRDDLLSAFVTEARVTGFLEHPNIVPVHELGLAQEAGLYYTMKLIAGESLRDVLRRLRSEEPETVSRTTPFGLLGIFRKVCDAVAYAHANRLLHLDIKPHNVLLGPYGEVLLTDWGLARICGDPRDERDPVRRAFLSALLDSMRARLSHVAGTPAFMSPEQAGGDAEALDQRTDVFLLGATLYSMFTLSAPYATPQLDEAVALARRCEFPPPQARSPERQIPEEVSRIILKAMAREKEERYASVAELAAEVDAVMAGRWRPETQMRFAPGELLMKQGDAAQESYVILRGRVRVYHESEGARAFLRECGAGEIVGEMALISHQPRSATVEATEETLVAVVTQERLEEQLRGLPPYMASMLSLLVARLRDFGGLR